MRYCRNCKVKLTNDLEYCPLCDMETDLTDDNFEDDYPYVKSRFSRRFLLKMITFSSFLLLATSLLVDHLVPTGNPWAFITVGAILYAWITAMGVLKSTPNPASIMLSQVFTVSGLTVLIDFLTGWYRWSFNYVIPSLIIAAAIAITLMMVIKPHKYRAYTIYQLIIAILGVVSLLLWVFDFSQIEWMVIASSGVSLLCFITMLVFSNRKTRNELVKRFHI